MPGLDKTVRRSALVLRRDFALIAGAALVARIVLWADLADTAVWQPFFGDMLANWRLAEAIASTPELVPPLVNTPLYPWLLSLIFKTGLPPLGTAIVLQILLGVLAAMLAGRMAGRLYGRGVGLVAGLIMATAGAKVATDLLILPHTLEIVLDLAALCWLIDNRGQKRRFLAAGIALGLSIFLRPGMLLFAPFALAWTFSDSTRVTTRKHMTCTAVLALGLLLPLLPSFLFSTDDALPFPEEAGVAFFMGNSQVGTARVQHPVSHSTPASISSRKSTAWKIHSRLSDAQTVAEEELGHPLERNAVSAYWGGRALAWLVADPLRSLRLGLNKFYYLVNAYEIPFNLDLTDVSRRYAPSLRLLMGVGPLWIIPLGLLGLLRLPHNRRTRLLMLFILSQAVVLWVFYTTAQNRLVLVAVLSIFAAAASMALAALVLAADRQRLIGLGMVLGALLTLTNTELAGVTDARGFTELPRSLAKAHLSLGQPGYALSDYQRATELDPGDSSLHRAIGRLGEQINDPETAIAAYRCAIALQPDDRDTLTRLGRLLVETGRLTEGSTFFRRVLARKPDHFDALLGLAEALFRLGERKQARIVLDRAAAQRPGDADLQHLQFELSGQQK